jgi:homoserine kinase type II
MIIDARALDTILTAWPVGAPRRYEQRHSGINNLSWQVTSPDATYFLRIYQNTRDLAFLRYEHALLQGLRETELSFGVPVPIATHTGDTLAIVEIVDHHGAGAQRVAALTPLLPGQHPDRTNPGAIRVAAGALGELDCALATVRVDRFSPWPTYGDLHAIHPAVPHPLSLPDELAENAAQRAQLHALFATVMAAVPTLYDTLPQQIIHSDYSIGNILVADGQVTGVLDFEFAARDIRAMDFVVGLYLVALNQALQQGAVIWERVEAFCDGYSRWVHLTEAEIAALPMLLRLRLLVTLVHWTGRARLGFATMDELTEYRNDTLRVDTWLDQTGAELVARVRRSHGG